MIESKKRDTREQILAQSYDKHISVTANAGSGKTSVLEKRYINLLLDTELELRPSTIATITFTKKAAAEILLRIAKSIEKLLENKSLPKNVLNRLQKIREQLHSAKISTIHSFCSSLLRDYPIESGVMPNCSDISNAELIRMHREAIISVISQGLEDEEKNEKMNNNIFLAFERYKLEGFLNSIIFKRDILPQIKELYYKTDEEIVNFANKEFSITIVSDFLKFLSDFISIIDKFEQQITNQALRIIISDTLNSCKEIKNNVIEYYKTDELSNAISAIDVFLKMIDMLKDNKIINTGSYSFYKTKLKKDITADLLDEGNLILSKLTKIYDDYEVLNNSSEQLQMLYYSRAIIKMSDNLLDEIEAEKERLSGIDFDDMLIKTMLMLKDETTAQKIRRRFDYLMVDEFQDTNIIQYEIIKSLIPEIQNSSDAGEINLFIVGDAKQSIYGFRNADVRVFKKASEDIFAANETINIQRKKAGIKTSNNKIVNDLTNEEKNGDVKLSVSFRHKPAIAGFVNKICSNIMTGNDSEYDVKYSEFICAKGIDDLKKYINSEPISSDVASELIGSVTMLFNIEPYNKRGSIDEDENQTTEAKQLVQYLLKLVNNSPEEQKINYSDIAVLSRRKTRFDELISAFQEYNVPYILHSGKGFYNAPEVMDIISFLKFLHNTSDDTALTAILLSPYFALSDTDLYSISRDRNYNSLFDKLKEYKRNNKSKSNKNIFRAIEILDEIRKFAAQLSISHLIHKIAEKCSWYGTLERTSSRMQIEANIKKLIGFAREFENKGFRNLYDFVEELILINQASANESEAVFQTDVDAVNIMTIHSAKGLEFPVVAIFETNSKPGGNDTFHIDEKYGLTFPSPLYDVNDNIVKHYDTPIYRLAKRLKTEKGLAEEKRVLYVAMTRAKNHLIISANIKTKSKGGLYTPTGNLKMIFEGLGCLPDDIIDKNEVHYIEELKIYQNEKKSELSFKLPLRIITEVKDNGKIHNEFSVNNNIEIPKILLADIPVESRNDSFSATKFMIYNNDKNEFKQRYILGLPNINMFRGAEKKKDSEIDAAVYGTILHNVFEEINDWCQANGEILQEKLEKNITKNITVNRMQISDTLRDELFREIHSVTDSPFFKSRINEVLAGIKELSLNLPIGIDFLVAQIDLLIKNQENEHEIWDWKTNYIENNDALIELAKHYEQQMKLYTYFIMLRFPKQKNYLARLFFTKQATNSPNDESWIYTFSWAKQELVNFGIKINKEIEIIKGQL